MFWCVTSLCIWRVVPYFVQTTGRVKLKSASNTDSNVVRYVCKAMDELTKKRREGDKGFDRGLMYGHVWKARSCGFLRAVTKSSKSLKRVFISAPQQKPLHFWGSLVRQHGGGRTYTTGRENEIRVTAVTILDKSGFEAKACYGRKQTWKWSQHSEL